MKPSLLRPTFLAGALATAACANGTLPGRTAQHAGHPGAPEGYADLELTALASESTGLSGASAEATIYTCPMHPEVVANAPGPCPKCGMKLVPKPTPPKRGASSTP